MVMRIMKIMIKRIEMTIARREIPARLKPIVII